MNSVEYEKHIDYGVSDVEYVVRIYFQLSPVKFHSDVLGRIQSRFHSFEPLYLNSYCSAK
jgi:hypothetical protein